MNGHVCVGNGPVCFNNIALSCCPVRMVVLGEVRKNVLTIVIPDDVIWTEKWKRTRETLLGRFDRYIEEVRERMKTDAAASALVLASAHP